MIQVYEYGSPEFVAAMKEPGTSAVVTGTEAVVYSGEDSVIPENISSENPSV